jgi:hypothetical protein
VEAVAVPVPALPAPERWSLRSRCFMRDMNGGEVASGAARVLPAGSNPIQHSTARLKLIRGGDERRKLLKICVYSRVDPSNCAVLFLLFPPRRKYSIA